MAEKVVSVPGSGGPPVQQEPPLFVLPEKLRIAIELQCDRLFDAMASVKVAAAGMAQKYDCDKRGNIPFDRALRTIAESLDDIAGQLEPM
jgi:hypothetical protein